MATRANFGPPEGGEFMHEISTFSLRLGFRGIVLQVCLRSKLVWDKKLGYVGYKLCGHMIPSFFISSDHFDFEVVFQWKYIVLKNGLAPTTMRELPSGPHVLVCNDG